MVVRSARDVELSCRCGRVKGRLRDVSPRTVGRVVCYCDDCQAFAHHLGRPDLLDVQGGTDVVQVPPGVLAYSEGSDAIGCVRLREDGLFRFHATCCGTPLGNLVGPWLPYVGLPAEALGAIALDAIVGPPRARILGRFAIGEAPPGSVRPSPVFYAAVARLVLGWSLAGKRRPHPFFEPGARVPRVPARVLTHEEREALRPLCGPRPAA